MENKNYEEIMERLNKWLSTLQRIECMGFNCKHAYPDEYNWPECEQDLRGYIISSVENDEKRILCPYYESK